MQERSDLECTKFASDLEIGERMVLPPQARGLRVKFSEIQLIDVNRTHKHGKDVGLNSFSEDRALDPEVARMVFFHGVLTREEEKEER